MLNVGPTLVFMPFLAFTMWRLAPESKINFLGPLGFPLPTALATLSPLALPDRSLLRELLGTVAVGAVSGLIVETRLREDLC